MVCIGLIKWKNSVRQSLSAVMMLGLLLFAHPHQTRASDSSQFLRLAALGRSDCPLGALYDQSTDKCLPFKLWDEAYIANYTVFERATEEKYKVASGDSYSAAWQVFDMNAIVKMGFLFGMVSVEGSASLFKEKSVNSLVQRMSLVWQRKTAIKSIRMEAQLEHPERMYRKALETQATHVVTRVTYGGSFAMMFESQASNEAEASRIAGSLDVVVRSIPLVSVEGKASLQLSESQKQVANSMTVKCEGDVILSTPILSYESAKQAYQDLPKCFQTTFNIGPDGMPIGGGNPGNPLVLEMVPLSQYITGAQTLMYTISDNIVNAAVNVVERMDDILKRCNTKMAMINEYLLGAFPRLTREMRSFYNMIAEFKAQTERSIQILLPKVRSASVEELLLSSVVSEANHRLDLIDPNEWMELMEQQAAQFRGVLDMLPRPVEGVANSGCQLTNQAKDWVSLTGLDDERTVAIVLDFPVFQFLKPMRSILFDPIANETSMLEFRLRPFLFSSATVARFRQLRSFVEANNKEYNPLKGSLLRSVFIDRQSFPVIYAPALLNDTFNFQFYADGEVLCPAFYAPAAPTLISVRPPAPNATTVTLTLSTVPSCPRPLSFTIRITANGLLNKTVDAPVEPTASLSNLIFTVDVADIAQQGMTYGFSARSESAAGFSEWSNQIFVVLQPTPAPIGSTADWNWMLTSIANLTKSVASLQNENDQLRNQCIILKAGLKRYDDSVVIQKIMEHVQFYVSGSQKFNPETGTKGYNVFRFPNIVGVDIHATRTLFSGCAPAVYGKPEWLICCN